MAENILNSNWLGLISYEAALGRQHKAHFDVLDGGPGVVMGLEHKPVVTLGLRAKENSDILSFEHLKRNSFEVVQTKRGGLATLHSPGQLVVYPIFSLRSARLGVKDYVCKLLMVTQKTLEHFGVPCFTMRGAAPGIYSETGKLAFVGIQIKSGTSLHGVSVNINNNLEFFNAIAPCGQSEIKIDSTKNILNKELDLQEVFEYWYGLFLKEMN